VKASQRPAASLPPATLKFLRALKRNNRREWFQPRKEQYDAEVRAPMLALIERLAVDLRDVAPDVVVEAKNPR
jgi:uncharacterized protein (DUF2461 family)